MLVFRYEAGSLHGPSQGPFERLFITASVAWLVAKGALAACAVLDSWLSVPLLASPYLIWRSSSWWLPLFWETCACVLGLFTIDPTLKHYEAARRLLAQAVLFACVASIVHNEPYEQQEYAPPATTWLGKACQLAWLALGYVRAGISVTLTLWASAIFGKLRRDVGWPAFVGTLLLGCTASGARHLGLVPRPLKWAAACCGHVAITLFAGTLVMRFS